MSASLTERFRRKPVDDLAMRDEDYSSGKDQEILPIQASRSCPTMAHNSSIWLF